MAGADIVLLDIEGTTSSIDFVYETLFPFIRRELPAFLRDHWTHAPLRKASEQIARDSGAATFSVWAATENPIAQRDKLLAHIFRLMDADSKATGLKELQGLIGRIGYASGALRAHVYPDVPAALERWTSDGRRIAIYSSGSIAAQKQFFAHTVAGDLTPFLCAHFDTTSGPKRERASYATIAANLPAPPLSPARILFVSDVVEELNAARDAGLQTTLCIRPGNKPVAPNHSHRSVTTFDTL
jgi:enolase-phosphatase E1